MSNWMEQFKIQCRVHRAVILHGNVLDAFWENASLTGVPITDWVTKCLNENGFRDVVLWDLNSGAKPLTKEAESQLQASLQACSSGAETTSANSGAYALGLDEKELAPDLRQATQSASQFFQILLNRFSKNRTDSNKKPLVFLIDGAEALFGNSSSLSESERSQLLKLSSCLRNAECSLTTLALDSRQDLIVFIATQLGAIPSRFYQGNPTIANISVPLPDRNDRATFLGNGLNQFLTKEVLAPETTDFQECVDAMDGFTFRDMQQLICLSRTFREEPKSWQRLIQLYLYGEKKSPWEDLSRKRLLQLEEELKKQVRGQDHIISHVANVVIRSFMGLSGLQHSGRQQMPKGTLFFVGPTGVGKTEMAKAIARFLFGDEEACIRFDMSEYSAEQSDQRLVGAPPGFVGYEEGGQLTNAVRNRPFSVLLFDEIEKAHPRIFDKFLQILEDGRLTDSRGFTVSFSECIIIFTSNIGASEVSVDDPNPHQAFIGKVREKFIRQMHRPELLNRIGESNILPFNYLTDSEVLLQIVETKLGGLRRKLREKFHLTLEIENQQNALGVLLQGFDRQNGGRGIANRLNELLIEPLARELFKYESDELYGSSVLVKAREDHFVFRIKSE